MKNLILTNVIVLLMSTALWAQQGNYQSGARSSALAHASITLSDTWSIFNNIGALAEVEAPELIGSYRIPYGISELSTVTIGGAYPALGGTFGAGIHRFGKDLYNEHRLSLGYSNKLGIVSLGINTCYYQVHIEGGGTDGNLMIDFGGRATLSRQLYFGAHISNINQATLSDNRHSQIPTYLKTGLSYRPNSGLMLNIEAEKSLETSLNLKAGLEYMIVDRIYLRTGIETISHISSFGAGFYPERLHVDYAYAIHPELGDIHEVSFSYQIQR